MNLQRLRVVYDADDDQCKAQASELEKHAPSDFLVTSTPCRPDRHLVPVLVDSSEDIVLALDIALVPLLCKQIDECTKRPKLIAAVNTEFPCKLQHFSRHYPLCDHIVFTSEKFWEKVGRLPRTSALQLNGNPASSQPAYFDIFSEVLNTRLGATMVDPHRPCTDLSGAVTVFVTTVGASTFESCMKRLELQDSQFSIEVLDHVAPMSTAFQRMLDSCQTAYLVQVDEDMLLHPHAVRTLYERIAQATPKVALFVGILFDTHLDRCIQGVKIYRHDIVRHYPFLNVESCEVDQVNRLRKDGFEIKVQPYPAQYRRAEDVMGLHGTEWTANAIYERYSTQKRKQRRRPQSENWFGEYEAVFLQRFLSDPSELNFFALMGIVGGALSELDGRGEEKDFRRYPKLRGVETLHAFWKCIRS